MLIQATLLTLFLPTDMLICATLLTLSLPTDMLVRAALLTISLPVVGSNTARTLQQGQCLKWDANAATTVFYGCCKNVTLETAPTLAITALCPNRMTDYDTSLFPDGLYTFSRLELDQCLRVYDGRLITTDDVAPHKISEL